jgi:hypothetical protein
MSGFFGLRKEPQFFPFKLMELSRLFVNIQLTNRFQGKITFENQPIPAFVLCGLTGESEKFKTVLEYTD